MTENPKFKILIIDDEPEVREALKRVLLHHYQVLVASNGEEGLNLAELLLPDLILLDILMSDIDGITVCKTLKASDHTRHIPIIIITATGDDDKRAQSLTKGADDLISKPFRPKELLARIALRLNKAQEREEEILTCGNITLDCGKLEVTVDRKPVTLTVIEFKLLKFLVQNKDRVLSRDRIIDAMWQKEVTGRVVDNHIMSLRKKLSGSEYKLVSIYGAGYSLKRQ